MLPRGEEEPETGQDGHVYFVAPDSNDVYGKLFPLLLMEQLD